MTAKEAEARVIKYFATVHNAWVGYFEKGISGRQPFDIIVITKNFTYCIDVKECSKDYFPFDRVEENQELSFEFIDSLGNDSVDVGFVLTHKGMAYMLKYEDYIKLKKQGIKSVKVTEQTLLGELVYE